MRRLAVLGGLAGALVFPAAPALAEAEPALEPGARATIAVSVSTLWREPGIHRRLDRPSIGNPVRLKAWNRAMRTAAQRRWLVGRVQTQALYGQEVVVLDTRRRWVKIAVVDEPDPQDPNGYPGWVRKSQVKAGFEELGEYVVVLRRRTKLRLADSRIPVGYGTRFHPLEDPADSKWVSVATPDGPGRIRRAAVGPPREPARESILSDGRRFLGLRYIWGGLSAWGFDCSGLIWNLFRAHGMTIPRDADPQFRDGRRVSLKRLKPADLIFWGSKRYVHHVALYVGDGLMMEAPDSSGRVRIVPVRTGGLVGARRYLTR